MRPSVSVQGKSGTSKARVSSSSRLATLREGLRQKGFSEGATSHISRERHGVYCEGQRVWNWRYKGFQFVIQTGSKEIYMRTIPPQTSDGQYNSSGLLAESRRNSLLCSLSSLQRNSSSLSSITHSSGSQAYSR
jgi:hypothetical protein